MRHVTRHESLCETTQGGLDGWGEGEFSLRRRIAAFGSPLEAPANGNGQHRGYDERGSWTNHGSRTMLILPLYFRIGNSAVEHDPKTAMTIEGAVVIENFFSNSLVGQVDSVQWPRCPRFYRPKACHKRG